MLRRLLHGDAVASDSLKREDLDALTAWDLGADAGGACAVARAWPRHICKPLLSDVNEPKGEW
jgi:hypothetical protein